MEGEGQEGKEGKAVEMEEQGEGEHKGGRDVGERRRKKRER